MSTSGRKLSYRKKVLENFRQFISQEPPNRILIWSAYYLYFKLLLKKNSLRKSYHLKFQIPTARGLKILNSHFLKKCQKFDWDTSQHRPELLKSFDELERFFGTLSKRQKMAPRPMCRKSGAAPRAAPQRLSQKHQRSQTQQFALFRNVKFSSIHL